MLNRNHFKKIAAGVFWSALFGFTAYLLYRESEPDPNFRCTFIASAEAASVRLGDFDGPIRRIGISGYLDDPFEKRAYDFEGRASFVVDGQTQSYLARGSVFIWEPGKVGDLMITISSDEYARRDFTLITYDKHGALSKKPNVAFAFDNPDLKTVHPMQYRCSFIGPLPEPTDEKG